jgi:hypothetical protein
VTFDGDQDLPSLLTDPSSTKDVPQAEINAEPFDRPATLCAKRERRLSAASKSSAETVVKETSAVISIRGGKRSANPHQPFQASSESAVGLS